MNRIRAFGSHLAFVWDKNLIRLALVLALFAALIAANGTVALEGEPGAETSVVAN